MKVRNNLSDSAFAGVAMPAPQATNEAREYSNIPPRVAQGRVQPLPVEMRQANTVMIRRGGFALHNQSDLGQMAKFDDEHIAVEVVDSYPQMGRSVALQFLRWVQANPEGVVALPTGKSPELFIKFTQQFLVDWQQPAIQRELLGAGLDITSRPDLSKLTFVQLDEYFPMDPAHDRSFANYIERFYFDDRTGLGLSRDRAIVMSDLFSAGVDEGVDPNELWADGVDLTIRSKTAQNSRQLAQQKALAAVEHFCEAYEKRVADKGGIGFFLGGIGPDGHIAFNIAGTDADAPTHLVKLNYASAAAAATDLGGIRRDGAAVTIGLGTITARPDCHAIIIAAGESKANVVAQAVQGADDPSVPAHALRKLPNAKFCITQGAATGLVKRAGAERIQRIQRANSPSELNALAQEAIIKLALEQGLTISSLTTEDITHDPVVHLALGRLAQGGIDFDTVKTEVVARLVAAIDAGLTPPKETVYLHTEPHDDDILLGIWPQVNHLRQLGLTQHFWCLTAGFNAVTNRHMLACLDGALRFIHDDDAGFHRLWQTGYFADDIKAREDIQFYLADIQQGGDGLDGSALRTIRDCIAVFGDDSVANLITRIEGLISYFTDVAPGSKDPEAIQVLKGKRREQDSDACWAHLGVEPVNVHHDKLKFYTGDIFDSPPDEGDVQRILARIKTIDPGVVSLALDPESSGPDTHYKVLQGITAALQRYAQVEPEKAKALSIWGYRNVWNRWYPWDEIIATPVSDTDLASVDSVFKASYATQKQAAFPSAEHDGAFSEITQRIQQEQLAEFRTLLGNDFFDQHPNDRVREACGLNLHVELTVDTLQQWSHSLRTQMTNEPLPRSRL